MSLFRSLKHRSFLFLWLGQTVSRVGDFMYEIALAWWVLQKTGDAALMGAVLIFALTPSIIFYLIGGVAVDRLSRVGLMLASDLGRGAVALVVGALAFTDRLEIWQIFVASLFFGFVDAFFQPAFAALVPQLVPESDLPSANSLTSISLQLGRVLGPAIGAGVIALIGIPLAFALNGISFLVSAVFILPLLAIALPRAARETHTSVFHDMREGIKTVMESPWLRISIIVFALTNITLAGPFSVAMPFLVNDNLHASVDTLGLIYATFPLGYIIGGIWLGRQPKIRRRGVTMYVAAVVASLCLGAFGMLPPLWVLLVMALINGAALEMGHLIWINSMQEIVPNEKLGRVVSIDNMGSFALMPIGFALAGWGTNVFGAPLVFIVGGTATAIMSAAPLLLRAIREFD
jgi:DHA3 family tetracycline resistance protein-like MFS transporter